MNNVPINLYRELGVKPGVTPKQLKQAYRKSVMRYHPDTAKGGGNTEKFRQVTEAYKLLQKMTDEMHRSSKSSTSRAYDLKQKFTSVFKKNKQIKPQTTKKWPDKTEFHKSDNEKIKVNQQTSRLSLKELINCVELSENEFVRQVAMEAIAARKEESGVKYLLQLLQKSNSSFRSHVIKAIGLSGFQITTQPLLSFVMDDSIEISTSAIKALENISTINRTYIIEFLNKNMSNWKNPIFINLSKLKKNLSYATKSKYLLGKILLRSNKITKEQLEIALLLQKRFPLLLGQILRHLEYVSIPDIQNSVKSQRNSS